MCRRIKKMLIATATEMKNKFGYYLKVTEKKGEVYIERHGEIIAKLISVSGSDSYISEELKDLRRKQ